jgi:hypothetical protein
MKNFLDRFAEEIKTHLMFTFFHENISVFELMWKTAVEPDRPQKRFALHAG